jgi:hypothetical protein
VAIVDVSGAFMQADMDELVHVRFTGTMVDLLLKKLTERCMSHMSHLKGRRRCYTLSC